MATSSGRRHGGAAAFVETTAESTRSARELLDELDELFDLSVESTDSAARGSVRAGGPDSPICRSNCGATGCCSCTCIHTEALPDPSTVSKRAVVVR